MFGQVLKFERPVNGVVVEQRVTDGFINATAMAVAHEKNIADCFRSQEVFDFLIGLAEDMGLEIKYGISHKSGLERISRAYPELIVSRQGSPENGGGTWIHPDLSPRVGQWCSTRFSIQVSRWVREWMITGRNPLESTLDQEWSMWQQRYDIRIDLKDRLRPALMALTAQWAEANGKSPQTICSDVHDAMNERIQGIKSKTIKNKTGLSMADLIRDHFDTKPLAVYSAINTLAINFIVDEGMDPLEAVHKACDVFLSRSYVPKPVPMIENLYSQGKRLRAARKRKRLQEGIQTSLFDLLDQAS